MKKKKIINKLRESVGYCHSTMKGVHDSSDWALKSQQYLTAIIHMTSDIGRIVEEYESTRSKSGTIHQER